MQNLNSMVLAIAEFARKAVWDEGGQDLIEYALVIALIAFAAILGMQTLATDINAAFLQIGTTLTSSI